MKILPYSKKIDVNLNKIYKNLAPATKNLTFSKKTKLNTTKFIKISHIQQKF